jgi:hypothetical protein
MRFSAIVLRQHLYNTVRGYRQPPTEGCRPSGCPESWNRICRLPDRCGRASPRWVGRGNRGAGAVDSRHRSHPVTAALDIVARTKREKNEACRTNRSDDAGHGRGHESLGMLVSIGLHVTGSLHIKLDRFLPLKLLRVSQIGFNRIATSRFTEKKSVKSCRARSLGWRRQKPELGCDWPPNLACKVVLRG